jgi:phosphopantothenoylcysteine decarboxylase/phosphopantothenate--cysteine ligase
MHPVNDIKETKSSFLKNKTIVLGITGSIASVETVKLARELIRHGAKVIPVMTKSAAKIIHPDALWFATGKKPIVELTGATEHVTYLGRVKKPADLLLISPCTANTISKITHGIDDTSVTTFATTAIGSKIPVIIVPAMHLSMYDHTIVQKNIKKLKKVGINFIEPIIDKNKAKIPSIEKIVSNVIRIIGKNDYKNKKVLVIGGPTAEHIDDIRIITNTSSGKTAVNLSKFSFYRGADVTLWYGRRIVSIPEYVKRKDFFSINDLKKLVEKEKLSDFDYIFICAAISDYVPIKKKGKIPSGKKNITIELKSTEKIIEKIRRRAKNTKIIGFKAEEKSRELKEKAIDLLKQNKLDFVVANTIDGFGSDENKILLINKKEKTFHKKAKKDIITNFILDKVK